MCVPVLFAAHVGVKPKSDVDLAMRHVEKTILHIATISMMLTILSGGALSFAHVNSGEVSVWLHVMMAFVIALLTIHGTFLSDKKSFINGLNKRSSSYFWGMFAASLFCVCAITFIVTLKSL